MRDILRADGPEPTSPETDESRELASGFGPQDAHRVSLPVKTTRYFQHVRSRPDRATIRDEWIRHVLEHAEKTEVQSDGRVRKWARIAETDKFLRVIVLEDGETVHNAFFDRSFKESSE